MASEAQNPSRYREFEIRSRSDKSGGRWVVYRRPDMRVMTEGSLFHCMYWVQQRERDEFRPEIRGGYDEDGAD